MNHRNQRKKKTPLLLTFQIHLFSKKSDKNTTNIHPMESKTLYNA